MSFERVAPLLLPAAGGPGVVVRAGEEWRLEDADAAAIVWGREPTSTRVGPKLVRYAFNRERALTQLCRRPPARLSLSGVHRWYYAFVEARHLPATVSRLRGGAVVELAREPGAPRVLDAAPRAAGVSTRLARFHIGSGGQIVARALLDTGQNAVLRVARAGSPADPARQASALERLAPLEIAHVPHPLGQGYAGLTSWTAESRLAGRPPAALSPSLVAAVGEFCLRLPRAARPPEAFAADMSALVRHLPRLADDLLELEARTAPVIADLPSVLRHGDLWRGNLLVDHERLIGVVDWDTWHPDGVPGTDLLHLVAFARALATRRSLAEVLSQRPWEDELFAVATRRYWTEMGFHPSRDILEAIAVASWAGHTVANLDRYPESVSDDVWLGQHVKPLLRPLRS